MIKYDPKISNQTLVGNQWRGDCPFCGKENHFFMNSQNGLFDCKSCGEVGNWFKFQKLTKTGSVQETEKGKRKNFNLVSIVLDDTERQNEIENDIEPIELPEEFEIITKQTTPRAYRYLIKDRKFSYEQIKNNRLLYARTGKYWNRVIIPVFMFGELYGYFGRFIPMEGLGKIKRKYLNGYGLDFSKMLWNYDNIDNSKPVILLEGSFGGMRIDDNVVATFGKKISKYQIALLKLKRVKSLILLYDVDALSEMNKFGGKLIEDFNVRMFPLEEGQDIDDFDNTNKQLYRNVVKFSRPFSYNTIVSNRLSMKNYFQKSIQNV